MDLLEWLVTLMFQIKDHQAIGQDLLVDLQFSRERRQVPQSLMCGLPAFPVERVAGSRMGNDSPDPSFTSLSACQSSDLREKVPHKKLDTS